MKTAALVAAIVSQLGGLLLYGSETANNVLQLFHSLARVNGSLQRPPVLALDSTLIQRTGMILALSSKHGERAAIGSRCLKAISVATVRGQVKFEFCAAKKEE